MDVNQRVNNHAVLSFYSENAKLFISFWYGKPIPFNHCLNNKSHNIHLMMNKCKLCSLFQQNLRDKILQCLRSKVTYLNHTVTNIFCQRF